MSKYKLPDGWRAYFDTDPLYVTDGTTTVDLTAETLSVEWIDESEDDYRPCQRCAEVPTALVRALLAELDDGGEG